MPVRAGTLDAHSDTPAVAPIRSGFAGPRQSARAYAAVMGSVDDYLSGIEDEGARDALTHVRDIVLQLVPDAEQGTSYGMPAMRLRGKPLIAFKSTKAHLAIYPFSPAVIDAVRDRLVGHSVSKGTIRFSTDQPVPDDVLRDLVRLRVAEIEG